MARLVRIVPDPVIRNGVYHDRSFTRARRRRGLRGRLVLAFGWTLLGLVCAIATALMLGLLIGLVWVLLAIGRAIGASSL